MMKDYEVQECNSVSLIIPKGRRDYWFHYYNEGPISGLGLAQSLAWKSEQRSQWEWFWSFSDRKSKLYLLCKFWFFYCAFLLCFLFSTLPIPYPNLWSIKYQHVSKKCCEFFGNIRKKNKRKSPQRYSKGKIWWWLHEGVHFLKIYLPPHIWFVYFSAILKR